MGISKIRGFNSTNMITPDFTRCCTHKGTSNVNKLRFPYYILTVSTASTALSIMSSIVLVDLIIKKFMILYVYFLLPANAEINGIQNHF